VTAAAAFAARVAADVAAGGSASPIPGGTCVRTPALPDIWDLNVALLGPEATDGDVAGALALAVRRVTMFRAYDGPVPDGWQVARSLLMVAGDNPPAAPPEVAEVDHRTLQSVRDTFEPEHADQVRAMYDAFAAAGARTFAIGRSAWAVVANGCIDDVYVVEPERGRGLGRLVTTAALAHGGWFLWTEAADPRPQALYRSLGMHVIGDVVQLTRPGG
jgi:GNAT superfamily N-acetyltransferase